MSSFRNARVASSARSPGSRPVSRRTTSSASLLRIRSISPSRVSNNRYAYGAPDAPVTPTTVRIAPRGTRSSIDNGTEISGPPRNLLISALFMNRSHPEEPMTTAFDVPALPLLQRLAGHLRTEGKVTEPDWAPFARTGVHTEKAPVQRDWWFLRAAAILRKVYILGPIGTSRLSAEFGGGPGDGAPPYHPPKGGRDILGRAPPQV